MYVCRKRHSSFREKPWGGDRWASNGEPALPAGGSPRPPAPHHVEGGRGGHGPSAPELRSSVGGRPNGEGKRDLQEKDAKQGPQPTSVTTDVTGTPSVPSVRGLEASQQHQCPGAEAHQQLLIEVTSDVLGHRQCPPQCLQQPHHPCPQEYSSVSIPQPGLASPLMPPRTGWSCLS